MDNKSRLRPLYIARILYDMTDEDHYLSTPEIISILKEKYEIEGYRTTITSDIEALIDFGMEIEVVKSSATQYHLISREFDLPEIKLLIDAVESSKFITEKKSKELVSKLGKLASQTQADELKRNLVPEGRIKPDNEYTWKRKYGGSPILSVIAKEMGVDKSTVSRYLKRMNEDGVLYYDGTTIETKEVNSHNSCLSKAMIVGSIPCGEPTLEEEYVEEYLNLPESFFGKGEFYILRAKGDSMEDAGICEGDLVIIKKQCAAEVGDIIVALDGDNQNTLKRYGGITKKGEAVLEYMNEAVYPGKTIRVKTLVVQGVAEHVLKSL